MGVQCNLFSSLVLVSLFRVYCVSVKGMLVCNRCIVSLKQTQDLSR